MALNLYYRINSTNPPIPTRDVVLSRPLTMEEIDGNMKAIDQGFESQNMTIESLQELVNNKAPTDRPSFSGYIKLPIVTNSTYPKPAEEGMIVYNQDLHEMVVYQEGKWIAISTQVTMSGFVKKTGDIMTGKLTGTIADFSQHIKALPPDQEVGAQNDIVATVEWVKSTVNYLIEQRLSGGEGGGIIIEKGDLVVNEGDIIVSGSITADRLRGHLDCGIL